MAETKYKVNTIKFRGHLKAVLLDGSTEGSAEGSALLALHNLVLLISEEDVQPDGVNETTDQQEMIEDIRVAAEDTFKDMKNSNPILKDRVKEDLARVLAPVARSLHAPTTTLDPLSHSCKAFVETDVQFFFQVLDLPLMHGWVLDPNENDPNYLNIVGGVSQSTLAQKISELETTLAASGSHLIKRLQDLMITSITEYGLSCIVEELQEEGLTILYANRQYNVLYKHEGELFTLVTSEKKKMQLPQSTWKKLTLDEENSFYVMDDFNPTTGQKNEKMAIDWWVHKVVDQIDELTPRKMSKPKRKSSKDAKKDPSSLSGLLGAHEERTKSEAPTAQGSSSATTDVPDVDTGNTEPSLTTAQKFTDFLSRFRDGSSTINAPYFEGVAKGLIHTGSFKLYVPFDFIQNHNRDLAVEIQDKCPEIHIELVQSAAEFLVSCGANKGSAELLAELEIQDLPPRKSNQKFLDFADENEMVSACLLPQKDYTPTVVGRKMGLGYINYIFDKFEEGKCWGKEGWKKEDMETRKNGTKFIITKEPTEDLTPDLGVQNLTCYVNNVFGCYKKEDVSPHYPAFFEPFMEAILLFPEKDSPRWKPFVKLMRYALNLRAPLVRSTLILEFYRVLSLQIALHPRDHTVITRPKKITVGWRGKVRHVMPFKNVYNFKNNISADYSEDKWENSHWHVIKYSRHFIEHVMEYIKAMCLLHDISIAELMLARCLESDIAEAITTIVLEYGVDDLLYSAWDHFERSDSNTMPRQLTFKETIGSSTPSIGQQTVLQEKLRINVSPVKSGDRVASQVYSELYRPGLSLLLEYDLSELKKLLESKGFTVDSSDSDKTSEDWVIVRKIIKADESKVAVEGPFCPEYTGILDHVGTWLNGVDKK